MGYYTRYSEYIEITPPLSWQEIKNCPDDLEDLELQIERFVKETDEGEITTYRARYIKPRYEEEYKGYGILQELQKLVDLYGKSHSFSGYIHAEGEEAGDIWRMVVRTGKFGRLVATKVEPQIIWDEDAQ